MTKFINNLYKVLAYHLPETTLESISDELLKNGHIATIPYKYPIKKYLYLSEALDSMQLTKERKIARTIYRDMLNHIYEYLSQHERDMIGIYKTYGSIASFPYDIDEHRLSSIYKILDDENSFDIKTKFGKLKFKFCERKDYDVNKDTLMGYDDELKAFIIFIDDGKDITTKDIVELFLDDGNKHLHELQHYIDDVLNQKVNKSYDQTDDEAYLNDPDEFKANLQMIIGSFGRFLFKNSNVIIFDKLKEKEYINNLFNIFLGYDKNNKFTDIISDNTKSMFRKEIFYLNDENKNEFYKQLYTYTSDYYATNDDIDFKEKVNVKNEMTRLFRLEENFI